MEAFQADNDVAGEYFQFHLKNDCNNCKMIEN